MQHHEETHHTSHDSVSVVRTTFKVYGKWHTLIFRAPANQKPLNRSSPNLNGVITSWTSATKNLGSIRPGVLAPHIGEIYTLPVQNLLLFWFFNSPTARLIPLSPVAMATKFGTKLALTRACVRDFGEIFTPLWGFSGMGHRMLPIAFSSDRPRCHGNEIQDRIGYNSVCVKTYLEIFCICGEFSEMGHQMLLTEFYPRPTLVAMATNSRTKWADCQLKLACKDAICPIQGYPNDFCCFRGLISSHRPYTQL